MTAPPALRRGDTGEAVRDLQQRLGALGFSLGGDDWGRFASGTEAAVRALQESRGLVVDGLCGRQTWSALVESGFSLGDRMLYFRQPMLRGDDVAELQRRLNALGFDAGREDGILGDQTADAIVEFQRNAGLASDGICGSATVAALHRLGTLANGSVATVREREILRRGPHHLHGRRVYVLATPGFDTLGDAVARGLVNVGADAVLDNTGDDESFVAGEANRFGADLFLALRSGETDECRAAYFASGRFRSEAGYRVARAVQEELAAFFPASSEPCGRAYALLRETRMAAVVCELVARGDIDGMRRLVARAGDVGRAIVAGVRRGIEEPPDDTG